MKATLEVGRWRATLGAAATLVFASIAVWPAEAAETIAGWGQGGGKVNFPRGVAVDQEAGDLYVADRNNVRVQKFDAGGNFQLAWGYGVADGVSEELQVCGPAAEPPTVRCFKGELGHFAPESVAVEKPSHDIYVGEQYDIAKFTASSQLIYMVGRNVNKTKKAEAGATQAEKDFCAAASGDTCDRGESGTGPGEFSAGVYHPVLPMAFDSAGKLWVGDEGRLERFDPDGSFLEDVSLPVGARHSALAIDPKTGNFYLLGPQGHNEEQNVEAIPSSTKGEYTLSFEGQVTAAIPGNAPANQAGCPSGEPDCRNIQSALEALPTVGPGNVSVARTPDFKGDEGDLPAVVTFIHDLGGRDVPQMSASGGSPAVTVSTQTQGNPGSIEKLDPTGALIETLDDEAGDLPEALATDSVGNLYVGDRGSPYHFLRYDSSANLTSSFGAGQVIGGPEGNALAVDEGNQVRSQSLYSASSTGAFADESSAVKANVAVQRFDLPQPGPLPEDQHVEDLLPTTVTLAAELNPEGHETEYRFEYGTSESYGQSTPAETLVGEGFDPEAVEAQLEGLTPNTTYHFRLVATDHGNPGCAETSEECEVQGEDTTFTTPTAVGIEAEWASDLSAHDVTLNARLDPLGTAATWSLEYDTSSYAQGEAAHGIHVSGGTLPASFGEIPVAVALGGLEASTIYHYRFVAEDKRDGVPYTTLGDDRSFTTQPAGIGFALPDDRAWEMVSPPEKHGGRIVAPNGLEGGQVQAAADGNGLAYLTYGSLEANPEGSRLIEKSSQLSRRGAGGRWSTRDLTPPHTEVLPLELGEGFEYKLFSTNLGQALLQPRDGTPLSPATTERTPYVRENAEPPAYTPLVTAAEVPPGTEFGRLGPKAQAQEIANGNVVVKDASSDMRHVVLGSKVPLAIGAAVDSLYEWSAGSLEPISVKPGEADAVEATLGSDVGSTVGAISEDGSRVFWTSGGLYLRDTTRDETLRLDEIQPGGFGTGAIKPTFQGANSQGTIAFFTDTQNLTEDANEEGADLYRCQVVVEGSGLKCDLTDLTAGVAHFGESAEVLGVLAGMGEDGSRAYFVARGVLDEVPSSKGESAMPGQPNLYTWHEGEGIRFVATLSLEDSTDWGLSRGSKTAAAWSLSAGTSPSGRYLAFMSQLPLSGYDNRDVSSDEPAQEVFRYDATAEALTCVSCNPSGARPHALVPVQFSATDELDPQFLWVGKPVAAVVPDVTTLSNGGASIYRPRYVYDDGRVFFNAGDSLVAADSNGTGDVYEYEPTGTGSCTAASGGAGTAVAPGGCVSLLSSGHAANPAAFIDASEDGSDVFFYTSDRLSVTDVDGEVDVYDARENGEPARLEPTAECLGEACQPPAVPPETQTPASAAFQGPGNVRKASKGTRHCPKGKRKATRKGNARCVKRSPHHRRHHQKHRDGRAH